MSMARMSPSNIVGRMANTIVWPHWKPPTARLIFARLRPYHKAGCNGLKSNSFTGSGFGLGSRLANQSPLLALSGHDAGFRFTEGVFDGQFKVHRNGAIVVPRFVLIKECLSGHAV
jgi:hypothetical protein